MQSRVRGVLVALSVFFGTSLAPAQEVTGTLAGTLVDAQGMAVPRATVMVIGLQGSKASITDAKGRFATPLLVPGRYDVRAELQGYKAVDVRDVTINVGRTTELNLTMELGGLIETVNMAGLVVIIDTTSTTAGTTLSGEMLLQLPVGRRMSDALHVAPGVSATSAGLPAVALAKAGLANPSISGGSAFDNHYVLDGVNITNPRHGTLGSYSNAFGALGNGTPIDFIHEILVKTDGYEAEFGQSMGGVVNAVTKSGSNRRRGSVFAYAQPREFDVGIAATGPIVRNRLFFFGGIDPAWELERDHRTLAYSAKATFQFVPQHRVDASFFGDPSHGPMDRGFGGHNHIVSYHGLLTPDWFVEASFARASAFARSRSRELRRDEHTGVQEVPLGGGPFEEDDSSNKQWRIKVTNAVAGHQVRYGIGYEDVERAVPTTQSHWNFFVQDHWKPTDRLTVNAGMRYEQETIEASAVTGNWAPRVGVVYDAIGNRRSRLFASGGRFYGRIRSSDRDAKPPFHDQFAAGFEWEARSNAVVGIRYVHRDVGRAIGEPVHDYDAMELTVDGRVTDKWSVLGSYRFSRLDPAFERDRPHEFKLNGNYTMDNGLGFGLVVTASSIRLRSFGASAGQVESQTNLRASYNVRIRDRPVTLIADAFNVFNVRRTIQSPSSLRLGTRIEW